MGEDEDWMCQMFGRLSSDIFSGVLKSVGLVSDVTFWYSLIKKLVMPKKSKAVLLLG